MITIGIDARAMLSPHPRGIGKTLWQLYQELVTLASDWRFYFYMEPHQILHCPWNPLPENTELKPIDIPGYRWNLWQDVRLPLAAWIDDVNLLHCPAQTAPQWCPVPFIVTIHDIIPLRIDDGLNEKALWRFEKNLRHSLHKAQRLICISDYTRIDLLDFFNDFATAPIDVIPWAPEYSLTAFNEFSLQQLRTQYGVEQAPFFLALGGEAPRKNTLKLFDAFRGFCEQDESWHLLVVGIQESVRQIWQHQVSHWSCASRIHLYGYVSDHDMPQLYAAAGTMVFPSFYEGFGLPLLDAIACGCPLIASNRTSIPEVAGDAALYFDPGETLAIQVAMLRISTDAALRTTLKERGLVRASGFTWQNTAIQTYHAFQAALGER